MAKLKPRPEEAELVREAAKRIGDGLNVYSCSALRAVLRNLPEFDFLIHLYSSLFSQHPWFCGPNNQNLCSDETYTLDEQRADRVLALRMFANMLEKGTLP